MRSTFMALEIAKKAVLAQQGALDVTGHNVANANTKGYSRQVANLVTTQPYFAPQIYQPPVGQIGTGVVLKEVARVRDEFIDLQYRNEAKTLGYWDSLNTALSKIEAISNEPSEEGIRGVLDKFWEAWQSLSESPESQAVRALVLQRGEVVADTFRHMYQQLVELRDDLNAGIKARVEEINSLAQQVANLNVEIQAVVVAGQSPNDLYDKRDVLLDRLSQLAGVEIHPDRNGMVSVQVGGSPLVLGGTPLAMGLTMDLQGLYKVVWDPHPEKHLGTSITGGTNWDPYVEVTLNSGELLGLLEARGEADNSVLGSTRRVVPQMMEMLNTLARTVVFTTNALHRGGYTLNNSRGDYPDGINFFDQEESGDGEWAKAIRVASHIEQDLNNIAAAGLPTRNSLGQPVNFGDGSNALALAQLKHRLNNDEYWAATQELNYSFPDTGNNFQGDLTVTYGGQNYLISLPPPSEPYRSIKEVARALNQALEEAGVGVYVRVEGKSLVFYAPSSDFQGVTLGSFPGGLVGPVRERTGMVKMATVDDYWRTQVSYLGVKKQEAQRMTDNQTTLLNQLESSRQSNSGVSLDEEMANMIKFQHAYNAAARFLTTMDEALEVIINRLGTVGR